MWYHVTKDDHGPEVVFKPRVPGTASKGREDVETPRVCFSPTVEQCLMAAEGVDDWKDALFELGRKRVRGIEFEPRPVYVYAIINRCKVLNPSKKQVPDVKRTAEVWRVVPTKLKKVGEIDRSSLETGKLVVNWY